jgi:L-amino acid N-acyltransferase YncA
LSGDSVSNRLSIRDATEEDLAAVQTIYAHHVNHGLASFEEVPPDLAEIAHRRDVTRGHDLPYLVAEQDGAVRGFAYASPFRSRSAYRYTVEDSVYVAPDSLSSGIGSALLSAVIERCTERGFRQMVAVIGDSANQASIGLHAKHGFVKSGLMPAVGFKFGRWVDSVRMQRPLGDGDKTLPE